MGSTAVATALAQPPEAVGPALLALAEDQWFDRKSAKIKAPGLAEAEVAFGNAEGGTIVVGLGNGTVEGIDRWPKTENALRQAAVDFTVPPVRAHARKVKCLRDDGTPDALLVIEVESGELVHTTHNDQCFLRIGDESRKLNYQQRLELIYDKGQAQFDARPLPNVSVDDLDQPLLDNYASAVGHPDPERVLNARNLLTRDGKMTAGAYLLFGKNPLDEFPEAFVRVLRYRGVERGTGADQQLIDDVRCERAIPWTIVEARQVVRDLQPTRRALGAEGRFVKEGLIPEDAWLEGIVNAVVHRSYSLAGDHIRVSIFDDRIEIESPGRFPGLVNLDDPLRVARFARNPRIARVCADLKIGQELGEGIRRMFAEMRRAGLADPLYRQTAGSVVLTLSAVNRLRPEVAALLPTRSQETLDILRAAGQLSTGDLADRMGMSKPATIKRLNALRAAGLVDWVGKSPRDPRAFWKLNLG